MPGQPVAGLTGHWPTGLRLPLAAEPPAHTSASCAAPERQEHCCPALAGPVAVAVYCALQIQEKVLADLERPA